MLRHFGIFAVAFATVLTVAALYGMSLAAQRGQPFEAFKMAGIASATALLGVWQFNSVRVNWHLLDDDDDDDE